MCGSVNLPTVESFLMMYPLRCGTIVILFWSLVRSFLCLFFFVVVPLEMFVKYSALGPLFVHYPKAAVEEDTAHHVYLCYVGLIIAEAFLFVASLSLFLDLYSAKPSTIPLYLVFRMLTWLVEVALLVVLALIHKALIGWYLGALVFIILELYAFVVVYSYYMELQIGCNKTCDAIPIFCN